MRTFLRRILVHYGLHRQKSIKDNFPVGRGTYGEPRVLFWRQDATLRIGAFCSISDEVTIFLGGDHRTDWITTYPFSDFRDSAKGITGHPRTKGDVIVGNDVWIGYGATILSGVRINNGAAVGARSVVTKDVPPYAIIAGNPAKLVAKRFPDETIELLERLAWWGWADDQIDRAMHLLLSGNVEGLAQFAASEFELFSVEKPADKIATSGSD